MKSKILMVDECVETIQRFEAFLGQDYDFHFVTNLKEAETTVKRSQTLFQMVILNVRMDGDSTLPFARNLKSYFINKNSALVFTDNEDKLASRLAALDLADEYVPLCISEQEIFLRLQSCFKRITPGNLPLCFADARLIFTRQSIAVLNKSGREMEIPLTRIEYKILFHLMTAKHGASKRQEITYAVWGKTTCSSRSLDVHLCFLRKKLSQTRIGIATVYRKGYRLVDMADETSASSLTA